MTIFGMRWSVRACGIDCTASFRPTWTAKIYVIWFTIAVFVVPFTVLSVLYTRVCVAVWRHRCFASGIETRQSSSRDSRSYDQSEPCLRYGKGIVDETAAGAPGTAGQVRRSPMMPGRQPRLFRWPALLDCNSPSTTCAVGKISSAPAAGVFAIDVAAEQPQNSGRRADRLCVLTSQKQELCEPGEMECHRNVPVVGNKEIRFICAGNAIKGYQSSMTRAKVKAVKFTVTVISSYLICWGVYFVSLFYFTMTSAPQRKYILLKHFVTSIRICKFIANYSQVRVCV
jgi:hypothetical protein